MKHYLLSIVATGMLLLGSSSYASEKVTVDNFVRAETDMALRDVFHLSEPLRLTQFFRQFLSEYYH
jgi:hypothetical protein